MIFKEFTIEELTNSIKYGTMPKKERIKDNGEYNIWSGYRIVGKYDECNIKKDQVIVVARGVGGTGDVKISTEDCYLTNLSIALDLNENIIIPKYLYYYFQIKNLRYLDSGSAQSQITINDLKKVRVFVPNIRIQEKLIRILELFDSKIELNNQININLQELVRTIYNSKFSNKDVNGKLKDILVLNKKNIRTKNEDLKYFPVDVLPMNYLITKEGKPNEEAQSSLVEFKKYDILIGAMRVYFHRVCLAVEDGITRTTTFVLRPKNSNYLYYSLITLDKDEFIKYANDGSKGSTMPYAVWNNNCEEYEIYVPTEKEALEFNKLVKPLFEIQINLERSNRNLSQLRDTLLPRLMNGEIDLANIEI